MFFAATLCVVSNALLAQNELDPVTVVSSLKPLNATSTGRNIFVLQGDDIAKLPVKSLDELLRYIPGVEVQQRGAMGSQSDFTIRGGTFQQVLVVVDGVRLNDPNTGHFSCYIPVLPDEIEKIEVLKGTSSALYGSDAVGGVINITTKVFAKKQIAKKGFKAAVSGGNFGSFNASASSIFSAKNSTVQIAANTNNTEGEQQRGIKGFVHSSAVAVALNHHYKNWNVAFRSSYDDRYFAAQNYYTNFVSDTAKEKVKSFWNQFSATYQKNKNQLALLAGFKNVEDNFQFNNVGIANSSFSNLYQAGLQYTYNYSAKTFLTSGLQFISRNISSNDRGKHTVNQMAAFAMLQHAFTKNFWTNASLRYDKNNVVDGVVVPQLNLSYKQKSLLLRASVGTSFRYADFTELYNNYNKTLVTSGKIGNPNLGAEQALNYELGMDVFASKSLKISWDVFQRDCKDLIDWATTAYANMPRQENLSPTGSYLLAKNVSKITTSGTELNVLYVKEFANKTKLTSSLGLVWLDSKSNEGQMTLYLAAHAKLLSNFSIRYAAKGYAISLNGIYKIRTEQPGTAVIAAVTENYFVANAKAEKNILGNKLIGFVQVDNLFNTSYNDFLGTSMPSRWIMCGVRVGL